MGCAYQRGRVWWIKFQDANGEPAYDPTPARTKAEAKALLREIEERVFRQRKGLEPRTLNPEGWTVADLMKWWLENYSSQSESHERNVGSVKANILAAPLASKKLEQVGPGDIEDLLNAKGRESAPATVNHVRAFLVRAFNKARKAQKWLGSNPAEETDTRRVPERIASILVPEEVLPFFTALAPEQRPVFATAILAGLRKGELCGLQKGDVDLGRRLLAVRRSYGRLSTKNMKQRVVRAPEELIPFLEQALVSFPGPWLFPDETGAMRTETWQPEDVLRRALKRAGIVTGYTHKCRRKGCGHEEAHADPDPRRCPRCDFLLWPKGQVRAIRFHDLRHTYASVLLMLGANLVSVQKLLGHSDPKITERRYGHLLPEFMSSEVNRLHFGLAGLAQPGSASLALAGSSTPTVTPELQSAPKPKGEAGTPLVSRGIPASFVAGCTGLEPVASGVTGRRYNQLN
jgi:integrase